MGKVFSINTIDLKPGVTEADLTDFLRDARYAVPGQTVYVTKGDRGPRSGHYLVIVEFESAELRDRYFPTEGSVSDDYKLRIAPFKAEMERFGELTTLPDPAFTDYHVIGQLN